MIGQRLRYKTRETWLEIEKIVLDESKQDNQYDEKRNNIVKDNLREINNSTRRETQGISGIVPELNAKRNF